MIYEPPRPFKGADIFDYLTKLVAWIRKDRVEAGYGLSEKGRVISLAFPPYKPPAPFYVAVLDNETIGVSGGIVYNTATQETVSDVQLDVSGLDDGAFYIWVERPVGSGAASIVLSSDPPATDVDPLTETFLLLASGVVTDGVISTYPIDIFWPGGNWYLRAGQVPIGGIIMWSGVTVPAGFALCDGSDNTPNLKGRFVVGYDPSEPDYDNPGTYSEEAPGEVGNTGGFELHGAVFDDEGDFVSEENNHPNHVINLSHAHQLFENDPMGYVDFADSPTCVSTGTGNACNNALTDWCDEGITSNTLTVMHGMTDNRPPYYTLAFIMRKF